jgi:hypothetical protein
VGQGMLFAFNLSIVVMMALLSLVAFFKIGGVSTFLFYLPSKPNHRPTGNCSPNSRKHFRNPNCRSELMFWIGMILRSHFLER